MTSDNRTPQGIDGRLHDLVAAAGRAAAAPAPHTIRRRARRRAVLRPVAVAAVVLVVAGGLTAFWRRSPAPVPPVPVPGGSAATSGTPSSGPLPAPTRAPATSAPAAPPPTPPGTTSGSAATVPCRAPQVTVGAGGNDAASGHRVLVLLFTNHGDTPCRMRGYPGVAAVDASGTQVAQATRTLSGHMGGVTAITSVLLPPGQTAAARVEALAADPQTGSPCAAWRSLLVTVPDDTVSSRVPWPGDGCADLEVHPVVPGQTGLGR
ncbi:DUF4232 domain-containing protein [Dactylosporangium sp. NPDC051541]|uniref:DUF4232 domain-containing protein n=1 Tax=Dactylosporangium sp. NPDC051541 TaxID=3363977 RepID=UPI0037A4E4C1